MSEKNYFFSHDVNAHDDIKIKRMFKKFGYAGYGIWWHILEIMRMQNEYKIEYSDDVLDALLFDTEFDVKEFINFCIEIKLFTLKDGYIFSESLNKRMVIYEEKIEQRRLAGKASAEKRKKKKSEHSLNGRSISLEQSSTIKENKIKENNIDISIYLSSDKIKNKLQRTFSGVTDSQISIIDSYVQKLGEDEVEDAIEKTAIRTNVADPISYIVSILGEKLKLINKDEE